MTNCVTTPQSKSSGSPTKTMVKFSSNALSMETQFKAGISHCTNN